ncbi:hypothetical protein J7400_07405 [Shimia sp. R9_2]|uniref:hypothetical protein n=1 Tax=unclassified Shimia TaxID=2630038 RepID=UPI001ADBFC3C|nr:MULTISPECIES: hypothetical protein [unclassified Shimia]MBO9396499.1 hypothetical protein [Shimia sp. R9_2]MBO9400327.1 hypothetical protein [Shimia sp. R9_3]
MSALETNTPEDFAARALEVLEQAYAYYSEPPRRPVLVQDSDEETYFEYVKAA